MNCLLVMKIKWSLDINTGAVERSEAARASRLAGATVVGDDVIASTGYMKKQPSHAYFMKETASSLGIRGSMGPHLCQTQPYFAANSRCKGVTEFPRKCGHCVEIERQNFL